MGVCRAEYSTAAPTMSSVIKRIDHFLLRITRTYSRRSVVACSVCTAVLIGPLNDAFHSNRIHKPQRGLRLTPPPGFHHHLESSTLTLAPRPPVTWRT